MLPSLFGPGTDTTVVRAKPTTNKSCPLAAFIDLVMAGASNGI